MHYNVPWFTKHRPESDETSRYGNLVEVLLGLRSTGTSTGIIDCCLSSLSIHLPPTHFTTGKHPVHFNNTELAMFLRLLINGREFGPVAWTNQVQSFPRNGRSAQGACWAPPPRYYRKCERGANEDHRSERAGAGKDNRARSRDRH